MFIKTAKREYINANMVQKVEPYVNLEYKDLICFNIYMVNGQYTDYIKRDPSVSFDDQVDAYMQQYNSQRRSSI